MENRVNTFNKLFEDLQTTNSRLEKEEIVKDFEYYNPNLLEDWYMILETLNGQHPIGWTFEPTAGETINFASIKDVLLYCKNIPDLTRESTQQVEINVGKKLGRFIEPIVNRTLRLGIGRSLLPKTHYSPMLARKYEGKPLPEAVYVTEKLDGNRCISYYDGKKWQFKSRNGKDMNVNFDMDKMPKQYVYDGEITSDYYSFNSLTGIISRHSKSKKHLLYNIFDIIIDEPYEVRRKEYLDTFKEYVSENVDILPVMYVGKDVDMINAALDFILMSGGEGVMLNLASRHYEQKRTNALLKYKQVQYMDMKVVGMFEGKGKYENSCGGIICELTTDDGKHIKCNVGTGLSDYERNMWWFGPEHYILGKIVQIGYHEITQSAENRGTNEYSLRFPRFVKIRKDKEDTSEY